MRGQAGIEGMVIITLIGVVMIFALTVYSQRSGEIAAMNVQIEAGKLCSVVKNSVNQVSSSGEGASAEVSLPETLLSKAYTMRMYGPDKKIVLSWENSSVTCGVLTPNVTNSTAGVFDFHKGMNVMRNIGGAINVSS